MARYTGAVCRLCRREGQKLFLKGERCYSEKCSVGIRGYAPGQHGQGRKKSASRKADRETFLRSPGKSVPSLF